MMKNLNEQLNIDFKNGTWSTKAKVDSTNPNSADYYSDYQTDEIESDSGKNINNNNSGDYSDYADAEEDNTTTQVNDYSDYVDIEKNDGATPTNSTTPNTTKKLTTLSKLELDIMQKHNPLVYKTAFDKLGAIEQQIVKDKLAPTNQDPKLQGANLNTTKKLTDLSKLELDIMQKNNPLVFKNALDKLGAIEQQTIKDKLAVK